MSNESWLNWIFGYDEDGTGCGCVTFGVLFFAFLLIIWALGVIGW